MQTLCLHITVGAKIIMQPLKNAYVSKMFVTFLF